MSLDSYSPPLRLRALRSRYSDGSLHWSLLLIACVGVVSAAVPSLTEPLNVASTQVGRGDITRFIALPGTLRANQQVTLQARVAGFVKSIAVDRGDPVQAGQLLAEIEVPERLAEQTQQKVVVRVAEAESRRLEAAHQKAPDLVTPQSLDAARGRLDMARAELEKTEMILGYANLTAPFSGIVTARFADPGAFLPAGVAGGASALLTLADTHILRAQVPVPELEAVLVRNGLPVKIRLEGIAGDPINAKISRSAGAIDELTRTLSVEIDLPNPSNLLRPGMSAAVRLGLETHTRTLQLPIDSIAVEKSGSFVFRIVEGLCKKVAVKTGFQDAGFIEILMGLEEGMRVISPAKSAPPNGTPVRTQESQ